MHKSERLFQLVNCLRGRRYAVSAESLATELGVSVRTIYRDIQDLQSQGVPIDGEAGVGYVLTNGSLPPLMLTLGELQALLLGSKMVSHWTDPVFREQAENAIRKIEAVVPDTLKQALDDYPIMVASYDYDDRCQQATRVVREAIDARRCVELSYKDVNGTPSLRIIEPLGMVYWGGKWTLVAYCQLRQDYREFRIDRVVAAKCCDQPFQTSNSKSMEHYVSLVKAKYGVEGGC
jgi:predicted DNA-binding transcriptional regulator YafY